LNSKELSIFKKKIILLQKFRHLPNFSLLTNCCFIVLTQSKTADLLVSILSLELKIVKRHKPLLNFLKRFFSLFISTTFSRIKGIKIIFKGRLNGVPRASHKIVSVGSIPVNTINSSISYSQATVHNLNGSYGIKVWIIEV